MYRKGEAIKEVNVTALRNNLPAYLGMVEASEELLLTSRGKKIARLTPVADRRAEARETLALLRGKCRVGDVVSPLNDK
ncbi:MAG: type II toxin-antitoxin system prevent-host-death family antitoxin [Deltaproteobacteria bacterium]|nr:type II toxin-antitoxin system prevent-host-death family antitoxin [Deltaproteobacteria bacterium]